MATYVQPRTPFGALDGSRLQALGSVKNRQNAISIHEDAKSPIGKPAEVKSNKRAFSPDTFDSFDAENIDPNILSSPSKKSKGYDGAPQKPSASRFNLITTPANSPAVARKNLSLSVPTTKNATPISHSRGSPKHKRIGLLAKGRRASSSPFRRIEPPSFNPSGASALPFSIDAALSGTISSYQPAQPTAAVSEPVLKKQEAPMPKSWFFAIHEDTPEEEASNLMEHSASILDISSDDDSETKRAKLESEIGKENVPPPDWTGPSPAGRRGAAAPAVHKGIHSKAKIAMKEEVAKKGDAMADDREALASLDSSDFYPEGLDEKSVEVVDEQKASSAIEKKATFDFVAPSAAASEDSEEKKVEAVVTAEEKAEEIFVRPDADVAPAAAS